MDVVREGPGTGSADPSAANRQDAPVAAQQSPVVVKDVKPKYTREAMDAGVQGSVEVEALIGTDGHVIDAKVLNGHPMLNESALDAVRQWEFKPIAEAKTVTIEMTFSLRSKR